MTPYEQLLEDLLVERQRPVPPSPAQLSRRAEMEEVWDALPARRVIARKELSELLRECEGWEIRHVDEHVRRRAAARSVRDGQRNRRGAVVRRLHDDDAIDHAV